MLVLMGSIANVNAQVVAYYTFDGNANDQSVNNNNATVDGNYSFVPNGLAGEESLRINGDNSLFYSGGGYVNLPQFSASLNSGFTVSLWANDVSIGSNPVGEEDFVSFGILDSAQTGIAINNNNPASPILEYYMDTGLGGPQHLDRVEIDIPITNLSAFENSWQNLAMTYTPGQFSAYLNGTLVGQGNIVFNGFPVSEAALGSHWWSDGQSARMSATLNNVAIFDQGLTADQIDTLYANDGSPIPEPSAYTTISGMAALVFVVIRRKRTPNKVGPLLH